VNPYDLKFGAKAWLSLASIREKDLEKSIRRGRVNDKQIQHGKAQIARLRAMAAEIARSYAAT
jgi:hypothetical protein